MRETAKKINPTRKKRGIKVSSTRLLWSGFFSFFTSMGRVNRRQNWKKRVLTGVWGGIFVLLLTAYWLEWPEHIYEKISSKTLDLSQKAGFKVSDVMVVGRHFACPEKILHAVNLKLGSAIFSRPLPTIKEELEKIPWILRATVHRHLPHTLLIKLEERVPIAVWQHQKVHYLVDAAGVVISNENLKEFSNLPVIVGGDAPLHAPKILLLLKSFPDIQKRTTALIRVGGRRWDLQLDRKIIIKLPELKIEDAMNRLLLLIQTNKINNHNFSAVDLRLQNQIVMRVQSTEPLKAT